MRLCVCVCFHCNLETMCVCVCVRARARVCGVFVGILKFSVCVCACVNVCWQLTLFWHKLGSNPGRSDNRRPLLHCTTRGHPCNAHFLVFQRITCVFTGTASTTVIRGTRCVGPPTFWTGRCVPGFRKPSASGSNPLGGGHTQRYVCACAYEYVACVRVQLRVCINLCGACVYACACKGGGMGPCVTTSATACVHMWCMRVVCVCVCVRARVHMSVWPTCKLLGLNLKFCHTHPLFLQA